LGGGVALYAAQSNTQIDAATAEKGRCPGRNQGKGAFVEKILSKEEIADLLSAVRHGEVDIESVGAASASASGSPGPAGRKQLKAEHCTLVKSDGPDSWKLKNYDLILDGFARNYALSLSTRFQRSVHVTLESLESMSFDSLLQRLSGRGAIGILQLEPLNGGALLVFDEQFSFALIEMVLGGDAESKTTIPERSMTAIELNVVRDVIAAACPELDKGFDQLFSIDSALVEVVSNLRLLNFVGPGAGVVAARFKTSIDSLEGAITLVLPHTALEPLQKKQQSKAVPLSSQKNSHWQNLVCDELEAMEVEIEGQLATLNLRVRDILNFQVGDVIDLGCKPDAPLKVLVEQRLKFYGKAGVQDGKKAIQIMGRVPMEVKR
jgi:flagellar motor switch protein FliM